MRIHKLAIASFPLLLIVCEPSVESCDPPMETVKIDELIYESDIAEMLKALQINGRSNITCIRACEYMYIGGRTYIFDAATDCSFQIASEVASDPATEIGYVRCIATGVEYGCG